MYALVFPGQGSQTTGMGREIAEASASARRIYEQADEILGYRLSRLCFEGDEEELRQTVHAQPALFVTSVATWAALSEQVELRPVCVAGHSVGEYAALVAAGVLDWQDGLRLVRKRAEAMQEAAERSPGTMAAVLGLDAEAVEEACQQASSAGVVVVANRNCPGQVVISGEAEAVAQAGELCKGKGAKRVIPLRVSGAFHSPLMQPAAERFREALQQVRFRAPRIPVVANRTADVVGEETDWVNLLTEQLLYAVRWEESVRRMAELGAQRFIELGPGDVLSGLIRRTLPEAQTLTVRNVEELHRAAETLRS
ncbi:MAG: ACP S-malonyltransferase [Armatimonadota bacterium]|nr:ACP S-malonyltransferase [Armatimonadota bacterium]MDW8105305.1 ACP S-malonyltransferase [Armatimonadota bacterium]MDW8289841.1 ACP S-malonyltransferase [Armatimonadota bacterium]